MSRFPKLTTLFSLALLAITVNNSHASEKDIIDTAIDSGSFKTLAAALRAADLVETLKGESAFTVFAPTDDAFAKLPEGTVESLLKPENKQQLVNVLLFHVVPGSVPASEVVKLNGAKSVNGQLIDIKAASGKVTVDNATVIKADIECSNGIIHVIDQVILPASDNIPETASKAGKFKTLLAAAKAAGLAEVLSNKGPFTVFAPTDEAFSKLPDGTLDSLLQPENKNKLAAILKYHVVSGRIYSMDALAEGKAKTLQGGMIQIGIKNDVASVNSAKLIATDIDASNGVIHVIDSVLLPSEKQASVHPGKMIEQAIHKGVALYNSGHHDACAKVYMTTAKDLLAMNEHGMSTSTAHALRAALHTSANTNCSTTQAWTMRNALNIAYHNVK